MRAKAPHFARPSDIQTKLKANGAELKGQAHGAKANGLGDKALKHGAEAYDLFATAQRQSFSAQS